MPKVIEKRKLFKFWNSGDYQPVHLMCERYGISMNTYYAWKAEYDKMLPQVSSTGVVKREEGLEKVEDGKDFNTVDFLRGREANVAKVLIEKIEGGKANAKEVELYYRIIGRLEKEDKKGAGNVTVNIGKLALIAERELERDAKREGMADKGVVEVQVEPDILCGDILQDTGSGDDEDTAVQVMGVSEGVITSDMED